MTPSPAPPPPPPPPAPEPTRNDPISGRGPLQAPQPRTVAIPEFIERNMLGNREPAKTTQVACGATSVTNVLQIRDPLKDQAHPDAEALIYVVGGEGLLVLPIADVPLSAGTFSLVPRGTTYTLQRRGRSGLVVLQTLTDTLCPKQRKSGGGSLRPAAGRRSSVALLIATHAPTRSACRWRRLRTNSSAMAC